MNGTGTDGREIELKILFVNKFLYPRAGAETYMFMLAGELARTGHTAAYFGMEDERNTVNVLRSDINVKNKDFHYSSFIKRMGYPLSIVYSLEARRKLKKVLENEKPDIVHLNNINYQITPSIIYELEKNNIPVVMTLHDANIICPNHSLYNYGSNRICTLCKSGRYINCINTRCIHNSVAKSMIGCLEGSLYKLLNTYFKINTLISPSRFMADMLKSFGMKHPDTRVIMNFSPPVSGRPDNNGGYVLYFGRICISKGLDVLLEAAARLPEMNFVVAGEGEYADRLSGHKNITVTGFLKGDSLKDCIRNARIVAVPSNWHENCSMAILEAKSFGVPVIASDTGGNPEIVRDGVDGLLFERGNAEQLAEKIRELYNNRERLRLLSENSLEFAKENSLRNYAEKICNIYNEQITKVKEAAKYECV